MVALPERFLEEMKKLLGEDYNRYLASMEEESCSALRVNTLKISVEQYREISPYVLQDIPWTPKGYIYTEKETEQPIPSRHPHYYAGLYYLQEPSAMIPAQILPIEPGDKVLDLCAAPGGKATELAAKLNGTGLLVANDISVSRTMALAKNLQMMGVKNSVVTAETPEKLAQGLPAYFDKILIDAPCSGEGMFRRDPRMVKDWLEHGPQYYEPIQAQILDEAWGMLKPGGMMVYSTCTFAFSEDEQQIQNFLDRHTDMAICDVPWVEGYSHGRPDMVPNGVDDLSKCIRIFPYQTKGEGHFAVLMQKHLQKSEETDRNIQQDIDGQTPPQGKKKGSNKPKKQNPLWEDPFMQEIESLPQWQHDGWKIQVRKENAMLTTDDMAYLTPFRTITQGILIGETKKGRFEPSVQLALTLTAQDYPRICNLPAEDQNVVRYLKGETVATDCLERGYILLCVDGYPLGWCKGNGNGTLKNKYYPGWRMM